MTAKELTTHVEKDVRDHFKPKKPLPKKPVDPAAKKFFLSMMCQPKPPLMSDYDHSITKSWEKKSNRRENQRVPQLGEQSKKTVPPLVVLSKEDEGTVEFIKETNLTKSQLLGREKIPVHQGAGRKPFVTGEPLMWPELIDTLPTRMHEFHKWYLKACAEGVYNGSRSN